MTRFVVTRSAWAVLFGAREDISLHIHIALLALRTGRPIKMVYDRSESFVGHVKRHPSRMWYRHEADANGLLVKVTARLLLDGGALHPHEPGRPRQRNVLHRRPIQM